MRLLQVGRVWYRTVRHYLLVPTGVLLASVVAVGLLMLLIGPVATWVGGSAVDAIKDPHDRAAAINAVRQTVLAGSAGLSVLVGLAFTARTYYLSRSGQVADRYAKAAAMLPSDRLEERIAAVYALQRLLAESAADHETIVQLLAAFIRSRTNVEGKPVPALPAQYADTGDENGYLRARPSADIQAALDVLGHRPRRPERYGINLSNADLRGADLNGMCFDRAEFIGAWLHGASTVETSLRGAWLYAAQPSWTAIRSFVDVQVEGLTAIQLANARFDSQTHVNDNLRKQAKELSAWWDAGYPDEKMPAWLSVGSTEGS